MSRIETDTPQQPLEPMSPIDWFIISRARMEELRQRVHRTGHGNLFEFQHLWNDMVTCRKQLTPAEWIPCPECGGRGTWVDNGNHWCPRCSGTSILLVSELTDPAVRRHPGRLPG
jgi:hypothetical protein